MYLHNWRKNRAQASVGQAQTKACEPVVQTLLEGRQKGKESLDKDLF